ncbi:MAG: zf-HC2 domain-containing protein [Actinobacteria bacterium]|nr:zf-HC2 domain-containing protein [Actinomycetota bacterium]
MHYEDGELMEYVDDESSSEARAQIEAHLSTCERCDRTVERLREDRLFAADALGRLQIAESVAGETPKEPIASVPSLRSPASARRWNWRERVVEFGWGRAASIAVAVLAISSLGFPQVRSAAADMLSVFRVEQIRTIALTQSDLQRIAFDLEAATGHVNMGALGEVWIEGDQESREVTLEEAQAAVDFPIVLPDTGVAGTPVLSLESGLTMKFKLNVDEVNDLLAYYGSEQELPRSLDGEAFEIRVPAMVFASYAENSEHYINEYAHIGQARSPQLIVPEGVNPLELRDVLISLPLLPEHVRQQLESIDNWQHTLIVPNIDGSAREISIGGIPAVLVYPEVTGEAIDAAAQDSGDPSTAEGTSLGETEPMTMVSVIWQQDGILRAVFTYGEERAIAIAESMIR